MEYRAILERWVHGRLESRSTLCAVVLLGTALFAAPPTHSQEPSSTSSSPFISIQQQLDSVVEKRLLAVQTPVSPVTPADAALHVATHPQLNSRQQSPLWPALRFERLGIDAQKIFREEGLPTELLVVAGVESNFKPFALSPKGARGLWQFMPATARRYGLRVDAFYDDRLDAEKSTRAAARYLRDLYAQFQNWPLALAAYNAGEDSVQKAIDRGGHADFWHLSNQKHLPKETRAYVPAVLKATGLPALRYGPTGRTAQRGTSVSKTVLFAASSPDPEDVRFSVGKTSRADGIAAPER